MMYYKHRNFKFEFPSEMLLVSKISHAKRPIRNRKILMDDYKVELWSQTT